MSVNLLKNDELAQLKEYCLKHYGLNYEVWAEVSAIKTKDAIWLVNHQAEAFLCHEGVNEEYESIGLRCFSGVCFPYKITDGFVKIFDNEIKKKKLNLKESQARAMLKGESIPYEEVVGHDGYNLLFIGNTYLGIGLKKGDQLISQIPKALRSQLAKDLEIRNK